MLNNNGDAIYQTHEVKNQSPPLQNYNAFTEDQVLSVAVEREGGGWAEKRLKEFGELTASEHMIALGFQANQNPPILRTHDRFGHRIDEVDYHPAWHELMKISIAAEVHAIPWNDSRPGSHVTRSALNFLLHQVTAALVVRCL